MNAIFPIGIQDESAGLVDALFATYSDQSERAQSKHVKLRHFQDGACKHEYTLLPDSI